MQDEKQEISFKDRLITIYRELDEINIEAVQQDIDNIKNEIDSLIKQCELAEAEKDEILIKDVIKTDNNYRCLQARYKKEKQMIIEKNKDDYEKANIKDIITIIVLVGLIIASGICLACL